MQALSPSMPKARVFSYIKQAVCGGRVQRSGKGFAESSAFLVAKMFIRMKFV